MSSHLSITLDTPTPQPGTPTQNSTNPLYTPGQLVSGKVHLTLAKATEISRVLVRFQGKCKTAITRSNGKNSHTYTYSHILFSFETLLFNGGNHKMRATSYEWAFAFEFPRSCEVRGLPFVGSGGSGSGANLWVSKPGIYSLPPSLRSAGSRSHCAISYTLRAKVPRNLADWISKTPLQFQPVRLEASPPSRPVVQRDSDGVKALKFRRMEDGAPRAVTTRESVKDVFMFREREKSETRVLEVVGYMTAPTVVVCGKPYVVSIVLRSKGAEGVVPGFTLHKIRAVLKGTTAVRVDGLFSDHTSDWEEKYTLVDTQAGLNIPLELNREKEVKGVYGARIVAPPNFQTVSVSRAYRVTIHVQVKCLDEIHDMTFGWGNVLLLPARMEEGIEEAAAMVANGEILVMGDVDESSAPPAFEDVAGSMAPPPMSEDVPPPSYLDSGGQGRKLLGSS